MAGRKVFADLDVLTAAEINGYLMDQSVMVFANAATRDANIPVAQRKPGMVAVSADTGYTHIWRVVGAWSGWTPLPGTIAITVIQFNTEALATNYAHAANTVVKWSGSTYLRSDVFLTPAQGTTKLQPIVPGMYTFSGVASFAPSGVGGRMVGISKNGTIVDGSQTATMPHNSLGTVIPTPTITIPMNGTTDYVELFGRQDSGAALTASGATGGRSGMCGVYAGPGTGGAALAQQPAPTKVTPTKAAKKAVRDER